MKIKVATTFSFRSDSKDGTNGERFVSSALTFQPDDSAELSEEGCLCGTEEEAVDNKCPGRDICMRLSSASKEEVCKLKAPRFMIIGKPCSGKSTLAKQLCEQFNCELVNATDLIEYHLTKPTSFGITIDELLRSGHDLDDQLVLEILKEKLQSPECVRNGFVLDGLPTYSEKALSIEKQLDFILSLENGPVYLIEIQITDEALRSRWEEMRIDFLDGRLYPKESYESLDSEGQPKSPGSKYTGHPDFPRVTDVVKSRLMIRHEELPESLDKHFRFYRAKVAGHLGDFLQNYDDNSVINVDGHVSPTERLQETLSKLSKLCHTSNSDALQVKVAPSLLKSLLDARDVFQGKPPRIVMVGKPCTGKTTLAKMLCSAWACRYVNASELISRHIQEGTGRGLEIRFLLQKGEDLSDSMVFNIVNEELQSSECRQSGYILDGIPTYSEKLLRVPTQLEFLARIYPPPTFWVFIDITDPELKARWETVRIDHSTGELYSYLNYDDSVKEPTGRCDFPLIDEETRDRLLTRHEELPENLKLHFQFYNEHVAELLEKFLNRFKPSSVIRLNGALCPVELGQELVNRMQNASCTVQCCTIPAEAPLRTSSSTERDTSETPILDYLTNVKSIWKNNPPRLVILGKHCTGKTTLSKMLCKAWGCCYVNVSELITRQLKEKSDRGLELPKLLQQGEDLPDLLVFSIVAEELQSPECRDKGYILDGLPTCSETLHQVPTQLEYLTQICPEPFFWVNIDVCAIYYRNV
ncbi:hypothetical protein PHET_09495 [Paragonimus heterotremus]|uniref:Nucleoside-diphosphate kinase n=1 Tax=Paragonimus heterotremus TaxID=100268 RepID=A0A8J4T2M8_9TREM|nr:hypothetical protein PHET_09495 [Paragonimus heterotremus]